MESPEPIGFGILEYESQIAGNRFEKLASCAHVDVLGVECRDAVIEVVDLRAALPVASGRCLVVPVFDESEQVVGGLCQSRALAFEAFDLRSDARSYCLSCRAEGVNPVGSVVRFVC